jgi:S-adenosylmethionine hydrolase
VPAGQPFWYANSSGLVEIAVNGGSAAAQLGLALGTPVAVEQPAVTVATPRAVS